MATTPGTQACPRVRLRFFLEHMASGAQCLLGKVCVCHFLWRRTLTVVFDSFADQLMDKVEARDPFLSEGNIEHRKQRQERQRFRRSRAAGKNGGWTFRVGRNCARSLSQYVAPSVHCVGLILVVVVVAVLAVVVITIVVSGDGGRSGGGGGVRRHSSSLPLCTGMKHSFAKPLTQGNFWPRSLQARLNSPPRNGTLCRCSSKIGD